MPTTQARGDILPISRTSAKELGAEELARGLESYDRGDRQAAARHIEQVVRLAQAEGLSNLACQAATYLGLIQMEQDNLERALHWFDRAQAVPTSPNRPPWSSLLSTLVRIGRAQAIAQEVDRQLMETQAQVTQEIQLLQAEAKEVILSLRQEMKRSPISVHSDRVPVSQDTVSPSMARRPSLIVQLLGHSEARLANGAAIALCSNQRGQALFKVLATQPHVRCHKETLLLLFWPNENPAVTAGKLHIAASRLRRSLLQAGLGSDALLFEEGCYSLNSELHVQSDVVLFDAHFCAGRRMAAMDEPDLAAAEYEAALALYHGPYVAEVVGEDWPLTERARLEEQCLVLLTKLASFYFDKSRYADSEECCRRILECDNLREDVYRQLMRCLSRAGQRNQALRLYQDCARILRTELGVEPMRETTELYERIRWEQAV